MIERDVFINVPFDRRYQPLFNSIVFTIQAAGFRPRCALEAINAGQFRLEKIMQIVGECSYAVHDLSRTQLSRDRLPRFNMPLELGLDLGCRRFGSKRQRDKRLLVLDVERYRYQRFISDIAGQDVSEHREDPRLAMRRVRDWLRAESKDPRIPGANHMSARHAIFRQALPRLCRQLNLRKSELTFSDLCETIRVWLEENEK